jgi:hypothetical protein
MAVDFRVVSFIIEGDDDETRSDEARFDSEVNRAAVAIQAFRLDMQPPSAAPEMNIVSVRASADRPVDNEVNVRLDTHYAGKQRGIEYRADVRVLVIADVKEQPS